MLRNPYGADTDPIDPFDFEEFTPREGLRGMLYASGAILAGLLLGETFIKGDGKKLNLGSIMSAGDMPYYYYEDADGDKVALPCTERLLSIDLASHVAAQRFMPVLTIKGRPEVRLGSFQSLTGKQLAGFWAPVAVGPAAPAAVTPPAPPMAEVPVAPAVSGVVETPAPAQAPTAEAATADAELDALLASLAAPAEAAASAPAAEGEAELDPALAALLADL
jgi:type VI secretion system protein ImpC